MNIRHLSIYNIKGSFHDQDRLDHELLKSDQYQVILTNDCSKYLTESDFLFIHNVPPKNVKNPAVFLIIIFIKPHNLPLRAKILNKNELPYGAGYHLYDLNLVDEINNQITPILSSLFLLFSHDLTLSLLSKATYVLDDNNFPHRSFFPRGWVTQVIKINDNLIGQFRQFIDNISNVNQLKTVLHLIREAINFENSKLSRFLFAFSAFEIIINKFYNIFKKDFHNSIVTNYASISFFNEFYNELVDRKSNFRLIDKYIIMVWGLKQHKSEKEFGLFKKIKSQRDKIAHGEIIQDDSLELNNLLELLLKYVHALTLYITTSKSQ